MPEIVHYVQSPLGEAAAWIGGGSRALTSWNWKRVKFSGFDGVCGIDGVLAGNVLIQMRYDWDPQKGFHVNATKNGQHRAYILQGQNSTTGHGMDPGLDWYRRSLNFMNNRKDNDGDERAVSAFMYGQI